MEHMTQKLNLNKIRGAMAEKGLTQEELANKVGISQRTMSLKLNGKVKVSVEDLVKFAKTLGKDISYFFEK